MNKNHIQGKRERTYLYQNLTFYVLLNTYFKCSSKISYLPQNKVRSLEFAFGFENVQMQLSSSRQNLLHNIFPVFATLQLRRSHVTEISGQ